MERETTIVETPIGKNKVEIRNWLTGGERRTLRGTFLNKVGVGMDKLSPEVKDFKLDEEIINEAENRLIKVAVASIDGDKGNILQRILDLRDEDYNFVLQKIDEIIGKKK